LRSRICIKDASSSGLPGSPTGDASDSSLPAGLQDARELPRQQREVVRNRTRWGRRIAWRSSPAQPARRPARGR
jgi:hypothetical protein